MRWFRSKENLPLITTVAVFVILFIAAGLKFPAFFSTRVPLNFFNDKAFIGVIAVGSTFVILSGGIDLSVGSMVGLSGILLAKMISAWHWHPFVAMAAILAMGTAIGALQGVLIAKFDIASFLVTLGGLFFCRGAALWISEESLDIKNPLFDKLSMFQIDKIPGGAYITAGPIIFVTMVILGTWMAKHTLFGRTVYAIGGNKASAALMGLRVEKTLIRTYAFSGFTAALGGLVFALYTSSGNALAGTGGELDVIAAVVIGGTLLSGGYGTVLGSMIGTLILAMIQTAITFDGRLSSWWTKITVGILLLVFMLLQRTLVKITSRRSAAT